MKIILVFVGVIVVAINAASNNALWNEFKRKYSKTYKSGLEEKIRYDNFISNLHKIGEHNSRYRFGKESYFLKINKFADLTDEEFEKQYLTFTESSHKVSETVEMPDDDKVPESIDWREKGAVLPVRDQGSCGACWAFSTTGSLEGQNAIHHNKSVVLSVQQLIDCSGYLGNSGCSGGNMETSYNFLMSQSICTEESYKYIAKTSSCKVDGISADVSLAGFKFLPNDELALKAAIGTIGPVAVAMNSFDLKLYGGGIFDNPKCLKYLNHAVLAVGYGTENNTDYWIIKNSWGTSWGENGYLYIARNKDKQCGIGLYNCYPILN